MDLHGETVGQYRDFGRDATDSPCFVDWCAGVVEDDDVLAWLGGAAGDQAAAQPGFAAARWHGVPAPGPYAGLRDALLGDDGSIRDTILTRSTQTNEVGRLATLAPAFALLGEEPLALLEVGAERRAVPVPRPLRVCVAHRGGDTLRSGRVRC